MEDSKKIHKTTAKAILDKGVPIIITDSDGNETSYTLKRLKLGTMIRISERLQNIEREILDSCLSVKEVFLQMQKTNLDDAVYCIACAITNKKQEPSDELIEQIKWGMETSDMANMLSIVVDMMDPESFIAGIVSVLGLDILTGMNPES